MRSWTINPCWPLGHCFISYQSPLDSLFSTHSRLLSDPQLYLQLQSSRPVNKLFPPLRMLISNLFLHLASSSSPLTSQLKVQLSQEIFPLQIRLWLLCTPTAICMWQQTLVGNHDSCLLVFMPSCDLLPFNLGKTLWLTSNQYNVAKVTYSKFKTLKRINFNLNVMMLYKIVTLLTRRLSCLLPLKNQAAIWKGTHGKELKATSSKNLKPFSGLQGTECCLGADPSPGKPQIRWQPQLCETLKQGSQVSNIWTLEWLKQI